MNENMEPPVGVEPTTSTLPRRRSNLSENEALTLSRDCSLLARAWGELGDRRQSACRRQSAWLAGAARWLNDEVLGGGA